MYQQSASGESSTSEGELEKLGGAVCGAGLSCVLSRYIFLLKRGVLNILVKWSRGQKCSKSDCSALNCTSLILWAEVYNNMG